MLEEMGSLAIAEWREPACSDRLPSIGMSLQRLFLGGLLPSRTRFASPVTDYSSFNRSLIGSSVCL
jgi:hypothetical protein